MGAREGERKREIRDEDEKTNRCARHDIVLYKVPVETLCNTPNNFCVLNVGTHVRSL